MLDVRAIANDRVLIVPKGVLAVMMRRVLSRDNNLDLLFLEAELGNRPRGLLRHAE